MKRSRQKKCGGFTLVEILVSLSILVLVGASVATLFLRGMQLYGRLDQMVRREEKTFFLERLTRDVRSGARYSLVPWTVEVDSLSFPSNRLKEGADAITRVMYRYDSGKKEILREESDFPFKTAGTARVVAENVRSVRFVALRDSEEEPPSRITVRLEYDVSSALEKKILVPVGRPAPAS